MFADTILGMGRTSIFESTIDDEIASISIDTVDECAGDPFEFLTAAYYESDMNMLKINQAIMCCEYAYLKENGSEMVYESNVVTSMFKSIGDGIKKAWHKICEFFKGIFSWLENAIRSDKKFVEKYEKKIKDIKGTVDIGSFKGYTYSKSTKLSANDSSIAANAKAMFAEIKSAAQNARDLKADGSAITSDTKVEDFLDKLRGKVIDENKCEKSDFAKKLSELFRGEESTNSKYSASELLPMLEIVKSAKQTKANLKSVYTETKGTVDTLLKTVKVLEKESAIADGKKAKESDSAKAYHVAGTIINSCTNMLTMINNKAGKALTAHNRQCKAIITKAVNKYSSSKKDDDDDDDKSSTLALPGPTSESFVDSVFESFLG